MVDQDKILQFIRSRGLVLPVQLATELKQNTFITGAILSSLVKAGQVQISNTKVGGSPVYYVREHETKLQDLYKNLNEKDKRSYDLLKQKKVLRDTELTPLLHVSVRNIKDFAKPFEAEADGKKELFWRWYLTSPSEALSLASAMLSPPAPVGAAAQPIMPVEKQAEPNAKEPEKEHTPGPAVPEEEKVVVENLAAERPVKEKPVVVKHVQERQQPPAENTDAVQELKASEPTSDSLHEKTKKYFNGTGITVKKTEVIKRNAEIDYIIDVPSAVGPVTYYCKVRAKKRCTEGDLAAAFVKGQTKKLPVLFVTTGECTKKAMEMLASDFYGMKVTSFEVKP
jgi:hypothetical protein